MATGRGLCRLGRRTAAHRSRGERSCRSDDGRIYPWGNDDASDQLANYNNAIGDTAPVGSYPAGQSAYGVLDLSGNLWEWTSSVEADYPYDATDGREDTATSAGNRAVRGGSFYYTNYQIRCAARTGFPTDTANEHIGFRIVLTAFN
ncbi:MAG: SUMF1/EgtB/PvdO family nonheme iron enzyme [Caldilineaceae bacterium]